LDGKVGVGVLKWEGMEVGVLEVGGEKMGVGNLEWAVGRIK